MTTHTKIRTPRQRILDEWGRSHGGNTAKVDVDVQAYRASGQGEADARLRVPHIAVVDDQLVLRVWAGTPARRVFADIPIPLAKIDFARALAAEWKNLK